MTNRLLRPVLIILILIAVTTFVIKYDRNFNNLVEKVDSHSRDTYEYICRISGFPTIDNGIIQVYADVIESNHPAKLKNLRLLLCLPDADYDIVKYGYILKLRGSISAPADSLNDGGFSYRRYLESQNVVGIFDRTESGDICCTDKNDNLPNFLYGIRRNVIIDIEKHFKNDEGALMKAMLTGDRSSLTEEMNEAYKRSGIYHIVSVSGLHAGIFISIISFALLFARIRSRKKRIITKLLSVIIGIALFIFTGFVISVTRVFSMLLIMFVAIVLRREYDALTALPVAAAVILLYMPYQFFSQSFQLTFLSTFGLCLALKICKNIIPDNMAGKYIITPFVVSIGATAATLYISVYNFHTISFMGIIANIIVIPISDMLLCAIVIFCTLTAILPKTIASAFELIPYLPAKMINTISLTLSKFEFSYIRISPYDLFASTLIIVTAIILVLLIMQKRRIAISIVIAVITVVNSGAMMYNKNNKYTKITFINAGLGESVLIQTPDAKNILIDCGSESSIDPAADIFVPYFETIGIKNIDMLLISSFDDRHTNAVTTLIRDGYIDKVLLPGEPRLTDETSKFNRRKIIDTAKRFEAECSILDHGDTIHGTKDISIKLISGNHKLNDNNAAGVYKVNCNNISFILSSDLGSKGQYTLSKEQMDCTVLKIPGYGAKTKFSEDYIQATSPEYAVITLPSKSKKYIFDPELEGILKNKNITYARTDINQTITFVTDGEVIKSVNLRKGELH